MKRHNITKSVLSISSPGTHLTPGDDAEARRLTRQVNNDMARICAEYPDSFLFFASLPLPDVPGSLEEIDYALDNLGAVGFQILTNSHGVYPGDSRFAPVFDKLSQRKTKVFFHPTSCHLRSADGQSVQDVNPQPGIPRPMVEFMFDSTRAYMSLFLSGTMTRCPGITVLACHCGGTFPPVLERIAEFSGPLLGKENQITSEYVKDILQKRFYFDLAGMPFPDKVQGLLRLVDPSRLVYGSDYPYTPGPFVSIMAARVENGLAELSKQFGRDVKGQVLKANAEEFLNGATE